MKAALQIMKAALQRLKDYVRRQGVAGLAKKLPQLPRLVKVFFDEMAYQQSLKADATRLPHVLREQAELAQRFNHRPLISVLLPTYKPRLEWLQEAVQSVLSQSYANWELCISDDASGDDTLTRYLKELAAQDSRIKISLRPKNGHICANTNEALSLANGQYIAFLDHDDLLDPRALFEVVDFLQKNPDTEFLYTNEDKINAQGLRSEPAHKGAFDLEKLYSTMFTGHLAVYRHSLIKDLQGLRLGTEGAQDWDLLLRAVEWAQKQGRSLRVGHVPKVLYHWRKHEGSTSSNPNSKPYAHKASFKVLTAHFERTQQNRSLIQSPAPGFYEWN